MQNAKRALLVLDAQTGDKKAWHSLVKEHHKGLVSFAVKLCHNTEMAQDIVQDTWLSAAKSLRSLRDPSLFKPWLYRILRWRVVDAQRKASRYEMSADDVDTALAEPQSAVQSPNNLWDRAELNELDKQCLHLFYLDELKITEIAVVLNVSAGTIKSRLHRARGRLKTLLENENEDR